MDISNEIKRKFIIVRYHAYSYGNLVYRLNNGHIPVSHWSLNTARYRERFKRNHGVEHGLRRSC